MGFKALTLTRTLSGKKRDEFPRPPATKSRKQPAQSAKLRAKNPKQYAMKNNAEKMTMTTTSIQQSTMDASSEKTPKRGLWRMRSSKESQSATSSKELHGTGIAFVEEEEEKLYDTAPESDAASDTAKFEHDLLSTFSWGSLDSEASGTLNTDKTTNTDRTGATELTFEFYERPLKCCGFVF